MNGNGQVIAAGAFLLVTVAIAVFAIGMLEVPSYEPKAEPMSLLVVDANEALFSPAPIELILQYTGDREQGPTPVEMLGGATAQIELVREYTGDREHGPTPVEMLAGATAQTVEQTRAVELTKLQEHGGVCSKR